MHVDVIEISAEIWLKTVNVFITTKIMVDCFIINKFSIIEKTFEIRCIKSKY